MKRFVIGAATVAAIAFYGHSWAQPAPATSPPPGATAPAPPAQSMNRMPAGGRATSERGATGSVTRAHHRRHTAQSARHTSAHGEAGGGGAGGTADQLNRQELSQVQVQGGNPTTMNRMPAGGRATSGGPNQ
jgi:hypothetical protein